jgi:hypothetical protein
VTAKLSQHNGTYTRFLSPVAAAAAVPFCCAAAPANILRCMLGQQVPMCACAAAHHRTEPVTDTAATHSSSTVYGCLLRGLRSAFALVTALSLAAAHTVGHAHH